MVGLPAGFRFGMDAYVVMEGDGVSLQHLRLYADHIADSISQCCIGGIAWNVHWHCIQRLNM